MVPSLKLCLVALLGAASVQAAPASDIVPTTASALERRASSCTFTGSKGAASAIKAKKSCSTITLNNVAVPAGTTLDLTGLNKGTKVIFEGETTFGYKEWSGPLVSVSGTDITVSGASGAVLNGDGARWWDGKGTNGGKTKPKFFYAHKMINSNIQNLKVKNSPVQVFSINGASELTLNKITIDNADVNSGKNIHFTGATCTGGHGISIGSVGGRSDNTVDTVNIENCSISNSQNGVRVKTVYGETGSVKGVTYKDITLSGITKYGVVIEQDYKNGSPTGTPTNGVPITGLTLNNVKGTVSSSATNVYVLCASGACSGWNWSGVSVKGGNTSSKCKNVPSSASC
ncbi:hypothetical protein N7509_005256 [Penicillium cosmopolitanum]|uniref:endo-polygalacturonase n=1 Tax=Penicillium cosmopolitanum TaxID=1131564 RepID=A0A9X0B9W7_9EURO|nr:uncharacterized protein N7509_005256 [Penicillium cosmopolitanum]KAJ5397143.1 hypothetical protein N7509_005256 [Penicillium cosmopolitanum]